MSDLLLHRDLEQKFVSLFNRKTGFYLRTGDPFMASFPELLDIGIMGHCQRGLSGECHIQCYQSGSVQNAPNMSLANFRHLAEQCAGKVFQFALGGRGDPNKHENFADILKICADNEIVPNFTTSGQAMSQAEVALCREYCGAVAVSWYNSPYTLPAIQTLLDAGVCTNIHFILSSVSIDEAIKHLQEDSFPKGINAVIFLLHKPVGLGELSRVLQDNDPRLQEFFQLVATNKNSMQIGFDSCTVPALVKYSEIDPDSFDACEGARWSAYISADMKMKPCSFCADANKWEEDLQQKTIAEVWQGAKFQAFRDILQNSCPGCEKKQLCKGGCPIESSIILCPDKMQFA